ncbi:MAG: peptidoglycan synthetase, partial [Bacteroidetes bacterium]
YQNTLDLADVACVYFSPHTLKMKKRPPLDPEKLPDFFGRPDLKVFTSPDDLAVFLSQMPKAHANWLLMSSGTFDGLDFGALTGESA